MTITVQNITIYQGADFSQNIALTDANNNPLNVAGLSANASFKIDPYSTNASIYVFQTLLSNGNLNMTMFANTTVNVPSGFYWYDVMIWSSTAVNRVAEGIVFVDPNISLSNTGT